MPMIPEEKISEIRASVNLVHYISQFVQLKKAGQNFKGLCPFHTEKTPSFIVSPAKQIFHCFGCGKGGNIFTFIADYEKLPFMDALRKAADFAGIALPRVEQDPATGDFFQRLYTISQIAANFFETKLYLPQNKSKLQYFLNRNLSAETIKRFQLGFAPDSYNQMLQILKKEKIDLKEASSLGLLQEKENSNDFYDKFRNRAIFPFHNLSGKICGFGGRRLDESQLPKYLNSPENPIYKKGNLLYGLYQAITPTRDSGYIFLVEGYFDLLRLVESGIKNVVASSGTALTADQARLIRRYTNQVYIAYDGDEAGIKAGIRNAAIIEQQDLSAFIIPIPKDEDPDTLIINKGLEAFEELVKNKKQPVEFQIDEFLKLDKNPSLDQKENFIQEALNTLAGLKNQVKTGLYVHLLADRLQINENMLVGQLNRIRRSLQRYPKAKQTQQESDQQTAIPKIQSGQYKAEQGIIALLLNGDKEILNYLTHRVHHDLFENEIIIQIYERLIHDLEDMGQIVPQTVVQEFQDNIPVTQLLSEIMLDEHTDTLKFARDCIYVLKKWQLEKQAHEITQIMKAESASPESNLHYTKELMQIRKEVAQLDKEFRGR